jgi:hypothetical protein
MHLLITSATARRRETTTHRFLLSACLTAIACIRPATVAAQIPQQGSALKSPPTSDSLAAITQRGRLLAEYDYVAWHASDSVLARHPAPGSFNVYVARREVAER